MTQAKVDLGTLGGRLRYVRLCRRYEAAVFCKLLFLPRWRLRDWETGKGPMPHDQLRLLAYYLEVPLRWLVTGEGEPPCQPLTEAQKIMAEIDISPETRLRRLVEKPGRPLLPDL